jgi:beta-N-acetylhexosaminidase
VIDPRPRDAIEALDLQPFRALASHLDAVMMAHVVYPCVDECPAGYSRRWIGDVLRGELGFSGVVISDDLDMAGGALDDGGDLGVRLAACAAAGCDLALVCCPDSARKLLGAVTEPVIVGAGAAPLRSSRPPLSMDEQRSVGEFRQWQASLAALC